MSTYIIYRDATSERDALYFVRLGLGLFWEGSPSVAEARRFRRRAQAAAMLHRCRKQQDGWRILRQVVAR